MLRINTRQTYFSSMELALDGIMVPQILTVLTLMILVENLVKTKRCINPQKWLKPWHIGTHLRVLRERESSNEHQHGRVQSVFKNLCVLVLCTKEASALKGPLFRIDNSSRTAGNEKGVWLKVVKTKHGLVVIQGFIDSHIEDPWGELWWVYVMWLGLIQSGSATRRSSLWCIKGRPHKSHQPALP